MRSVRVLRLFTVVALTAASATSVAAQQPDPPTREAAIEREQAEKVKTLHPYVPSKTEQLMTRAEDLLAGGPLSWHPFFENAYSGGGFAFGAGYAHHVTAYNYFDVRGSYTLRGYKRAEAEFVAPRLFQRRGHLSILGGWREATEAPFYGLGTNTTRDHELIYDFQQPYLSADLAVRPTRGNLLLRGGIEYTQWKQLSGDRSFPSVETVYTPQTLPGLGATVNYVHSQGTIGYDWRTSPGYSRRGGFYGVTFHDYNDRDKAFGFQQLDYEALQHLPILREAWVISLHALARTTSTKDGQQIPFFMRPALGSGSTLRGFTPHRFRDRNSLLLQAEWRIMVNRFFDTAVFYDAGKVTAHKSDLDLNGLKSDYGLGLRFHGPFATPLRVEIARSTEGVRLVFASSPTF